MLFGLFIIKIRNINPIVKIFEKKQIFYSMLIVEIKNGENIEKSLKTLKSKVIKTKQNQILFERKEYKKKSVLKRTEFLKAKYIQRKKLN